jgi:hypothetical protein
MPTDLSRCDGEGLKSAVSPIKLMEMGVRKKLEILAMNMTV